MPGNCFLPLIPAASWLSLSRNFGNFSPRQEQLGGIILSKCSISVPKPSQRGTLYSTCPSNSHLCVWSVSYAHGSRVQILFALEKQSPVSGWALFDKRMCGLGSWRRDSSCHFSCRLFSALALKLLSLACCFRDMSLSGQ